MRVLVCDTIHEDGIEKLRQTEFDVDVKTTISHEELRNTVSDYNALIVRSRTKVTKEIIEAGKQLKAIGRAGVGLDNIDLETAKKRGITVLNTPEAPSEAVAELTIGLMISLARHISLADRTMKDGKWIKKKLRGWELKGKTLGVVGLGNVGEKMAKIAKAMGMKILITKRTPPKPELLRELEGEFIPLPELLQRSDVITIHVPLTPQTNHMIGAKEFQLMKNGAFFINTSRGAIVDEKALLEALQSGKLGGAALDVYETEPPTDLTLMGLPNVICTCHIGAQTKEGQRAAAILIAEKIINSFR
ncbi:MAG: D-2-hydroxyacid dehydrogenase [Candidatus Bathyarchaeota archaeon]|nr:MAG: D-2-hydroxyacid dehydrogenase [Candidatus Bathyarchaeota archaeon]